MKTLVISDTHLTHFFDERKYIYLEEIFSSVDNIVLNGDFWDGYQTTFKAFVSSPWKKIFPLLKKKNTVYIYGNHDQEKFSNGYASLFSSFQKKNHLLIVNKIKYFLEHGDAICKSFDVAYPIPRKILYPINDLSHTLEHILVKLGSPHKKVLARENKKIKRILKARSFPYWYICGHTHYGEVDEVNRFANSGYVQFGRASYLIIDSSGISLHANRY